VFDSSPMYGRAEAVLGDLLAAAPDPARTFIATKVWTRGRQAGITQMERSFALLKVKRIDLMQVHNLLDWQTHMATLRKWKQDGRIRYLGVTHYTSSAYDELEAVMRKDLEQTMAIFSTALHFQFQGAPDFGYVRLHEIYSTNFARENAPVWHPIVENVMASPDMVTLFNEWKLIPAGGGDPLREYRGVDVFQREADCVWRVTASLNYADKSALALSPNPAGNSIGPASVSASKTQPLVAAHDSKARDASAGPR